MSQEVTIRCCSMWFSSQCWSGQLRNFLISSQLDGQWFYPRFIPFLVIAALLVYFNISRAHEKVQLLISIGGITVVLLVLLLLPDRPGSDSITMALIHSPFVMLSLLGIFFAAGSGASLQRGLQYIRYGGELLIFTALILLGGAC